LLKVKIYGTANIEIQVTDKNISDRDLWKMRQEFDEAFESAADRILEKYGLANEEVHTVLMDEFVKEL
jgi:hypothetical protein